MIRWQPGPSLRNRLRRTNPGDAAIAAFAGAIGALALLAVAGLAASFIP